MAQPTAYNKASDFSEYASANPDAPLDQSALDTEFDAIETTLDEVLENLEEIQRDDGALKNASVHPDALSTATKALIAATWTPQGLWVTATAYEVGDVVQNSTTSYVCAEDHTSGTFATDYAAGKWIILGETFSGAASAVTVTPAGNIASTNVQDALEELDDEKAAINGDAGETFAVADATDDDHAPNAGQIQTSSLISALATGTSDALTATIASGLSALTDRMHVRIEAASASATTAPTLNLTLGSTATGVKTIKKGSNTALAVGDIAGAGHMLELVYDLGNDCWLLQNPAFAISTSSATLTPDSVQNVGLSLAVGSSALTATLTTAAGGTPSSSNPVRAAMRSATASAGTWNTREATSGISLTVPSSATLGHSSNVASKLHWYFIDNAGTLELAVSTKFFGYSGIASTTAIDATATSATTMYSTSARSNVSFMWIAGTIDTQTTAGTWAAAPSAVSLVRRPENALAANGQVLVRDSAVDGLARSVGALRGVISGLVQSQAADTDHDTTISAGGAMDSTNAYWMSLDSAITKQIDAAWAVGTAAGGLDGSESVAGTPDANTWYYLWLIARSDTGVVDAIYSESSSAPTMPTNYDFKRLIGAVLTDGSANIVAYKAYEIGGGGLNVHWSAPPLDLDVSNQGATAVSRTLQIPVLPLNVWLNARASHGSTSASIYVRNPDTTDQASSTTAAPLGSISTSGSSGAGSMIVVRTNTGAVATRSDQTNTTIRLVTVAWEWARR